MNDRHEVKSSGLTASCLPDLGEDGGSTIGDRHWLRAHMGSWRGSVGGHRGVCEIVERGEGVHG